MIRVLVDGIAFQPGQPCPALPWRDVLQSLAGRADLQLQMLDRGGAPSLERVQLLPFPAYLKRDCAADSILIQQMAELFRVDVFVSTGWTTPLATPAVLVVAETERPQGQDHGRQALDRETALAFAQHYVCSGAQARATLRAAFPEIPEAAVRVAEPTAEALSETLATSIDVLHREQGLGRYKAFFAEWRRLRAVQASVDH